MDITTEIKKIMLDEKVNMVGLAKRLGTSQPNLSNKFKRNNFTIKELEEISAALNHKVEIKFIKSSKE